MEQNIFQEVYLNPLSDFGFKRLFYNELNKELLINFLNEVIREQGKITDISYLPTEQLGEKDSNRKAIFDIFCKNEKGEYFIVELQKAKQPHFRDRSIFYASFPIQHQAPKGIWNFQLKAVYLVAVLDFVIFDDSNEVLEQVRLFREQTMTLYSDKLNFIFVELPKFTKEVHELETNADRWLFSLKNLYRLNSRPNEVEGSVFENLFKTAEIKQLTHKEMEEYKKSVLEYQDVRDAVDYAREEGVEEGLEKGREEGIEIGVEKGIEIGVKKGREEGREEGRKEGVEEGVEQEKILIAKKCLKEGLPIETISKLTGLSIETINSLK